MTKSGNNYSLGFLFVLLTFCAIIAGMISAVIPRESDVGSVPSSGVVGGIIMAMSGLLVGLGVGAHHFKRRKGICIGLLAGLLVGLAIAPLGFASTSAAARIMIIQLGGSTMLVVIAALLRVSVRNTTPSDWDKVNSELSVPEPPADSDAPGASSDSI